MKKGTKIGEGTYGIVYSAISPGAHTYAVKRNLTDDNTSFLGALRELDMLASFRNHPYIVRLHSILFGTPFSDGQVVSPLIGTNRNRQKDAGIHFSYEKADCDLFEYMNKSETKDYEELKRFMVQILLAVEYMHGRGIIHRDIKPNNILYFRDTQTGESMIQITDFGLSKPYTYQGSQTPNAVTAWYRAPEICLCLPNYDYAVDIWSIGCVFYELVSGQAFIYDVDDNNGKILNKILGMLPKALPVEVYNKYILKARPRINITLVANPRMRYSYQKRMNLTSREITTFHAQAGSLADFCDLLEQLLEFDPSKRWNATQALNHRFFSDHKDLIGRTRELYPVITKPLEYKFIIKDCFERRWGMNIAFAIFNDKDKHEWYMDRIIFHAMEIFDRYLAIMFAIKKVPSNAIETKDRGRFHSRLEAELRFYVCIYICVKYFNSIYIPVSFKEIAPDKFHTEGTLHVAKEFESSLIYHGLKCEIYRTTVYEIADVFGDTLEEQEICDLIWLYGSCVWQDNLFPRDFYIEYKRNDFDDLLRRGK